jgi:hypothetical protein
VLFASLSAGRAHAQPVGQETFVIGSATVQDVSPVHDQGLLLDQIVFGRAGAIQRIDVQWNADHNVGPTVSPVFLVEDPGTFARFNPLKTGLDAGKVWRFISYEAGTQVGRIRLDAAAGTQLFIDTLGIGLNRDFPMPFTDGQRLVYELGGTDDVTIGDFDAAPEIIVDDGEVNEAPVASLVPPALPDANLVFYAKSSGNPEFPRTVHRLRVGEPDSYFLTLGGGLNNLGVIDAQSLTYTKFLQGFSQLFRNSIHGESLSHGVSSLLADPGTAGALLAPSFHPMTDHRSRSPQATSTVTR